MLNLRNILFPVDFSERSRSAAPFVAAMARRFDADVTLLHSMYAVEYHSMGAIEGGYFIDPAEMRAGFEREISRFRDAEFSGQRTATIVTSGEPASVITGMVHTGKADFIMMPTHGYGPFRSLLLGSITSKILHDAECPVWTGAHVETPPVKEHVETRRVLCAVDLSSRSLCVLRWAQEYCRAADAALRIVHATPDYEGVPSKGLNREFEQTLLKEAREQMARLQAQAGTDATSCVTGGNVARVIHDEAVEHKADLIVIGRSAKTGGLGRLRANAASIIRHAPCPVISV